MIRKLLQLEILVISTFSLPLATAETLEVRISATGQQYISFGDEIAFGYGASPQNLLTYLPSGNGNDAQRWLSWAKRYGLTNVRSYPPSIIVQEPAENLFLKSSSNPEKFDLTQFNPKYFDELRKICTQFRDNKIFVHLQLWQAVAWKKHWPINYYNSKNNVNPNISDHAGPGEFVTLDNPLLLAHQKQYVDLVLEATADLGNVFYDIINEIGNGTGRDGLWVLAMTDHIRSWERKSSTSLLLTINDESGGRLTMVEDVFAQMDLIIRDLGRYDEHTATQSQFRKPTVSVRNIDWNFDHRRRQYFHGEFSLETNQDPLLQTRGRKYWWRMFMSKVQMAGAYADSYLPGEDSLVSRYWNRLLRRLSVDTNDTKESSYELNLASETNFTHFIQFVRRIRDYQDLVTSITVIDGHPAAHAYGLISKVQFIVYLESPNGEAGHRYPSTRARLVNIQLPDGSYNGYFYFPANGWQQQFELDIEDGISEVVVPAFLDDLIIYVGVTD